MEFKHEPRRIYLENEQGKTIAEVCFSKVSENQITISHTFVDNCLRGQGVAGKLMKELASDLEKNHKTASATCSYAVDWFEKHDEYKDIYIND